MIRTYLVIFVFFIPLTDSCKKDTCNEKPTFLNIDGSIENVNPDFLNITFSWETNDVLPPEYFQEAHLMTSDRGYSFDNLDWQNDYNMVEKFSTDTNGLNLVLIRASLEEAKKSYELHFRFPDRKDFIDCKHPGSKDTYYLDISFYIEKSADTNFTLSDFEWKETLIKGGY